jgi:hypothetical protein
MKRQWDRLDAAGSFGSHSGLHVRTGGALSATGLALAIAEAGAPTASEVRLESAWVKGTTGARPEEFTGTQRGRISQRGHI